MSDAEAADTPDRADGPHGAQAPDRADGPHGAQVPDRADGPHGAQVSDRADGPHGPHGAQAPDRADVLAVFASGRFVDSDAEVGAIAFDPADAGRSLADGREVSGWSVFTGEETDEELTDAEAVRLPSLRWVLSRDPAVAFVTSGHDGTAGYWVREGDRGDGLPSWTPVDLDAGT